MDFGRVVFLNGTSSSGKTELAKTLQEILDGNYIHTGMDHYLERVPKKFAMVLDKKEPRPIHGGYLLLTEKGFVKEIKMGQDVYILLKGMYNAISSLVSAGVNVIVEDVIYDREILQAAVNTLYNYNVLFVGVFCPLELVEFREKKRGNRLRGLARVQYEKVHSHGVYDIKLDTSTISPMEGALKIKYRLEHGPEPTAFLELREKMI